MFAQNKIAILITDSLPNGITYEKRATDLAGVENEAGRVVTRLMNRGFLTASIDSIALKNDTARVFIFTGRSFSWGKIDYKHLPLPMIKQFGFEKSTKGLVNIEGLKNSMTQTIGFFENRGYPFAYFYWDSLAIEKDTIHGFLYFEKNILITFDTIALYGEGGVSKNFLYNYLGFRPGQVYDESVVRKMDDKLSKLPFTSVQGKARVYFVGRKAIILLNLKKRKTDRLDGIIGFAPNTGTPGSTKLLVTGEFHLDFKNLKGSGIGLKGDWQSFMARSQALNVGLNYPYILNQPIGTDLSAGFLKYDTLYTETKFGIAAQYIFSGLDNFRLFYEQKNTNLLFADTVAVRENRSLGNITAMKTQRYGLAFTASTVNNPLSPAKGEIINLSASVFKRKIEEDPRIRRVKFYDTGTKTQYTVYDSTKPVSYQLLFQYNLVKAHLLAKRVVLFSELSGFHFLSSKIYFNELYRFGGNYTLKGFNEQSLFASTVSIINVEIRYLLSDYSFLKMFGNAAYYKDKSDRPGKIPEDIPYGFGAGLNLETAGGIFNISVALGKSKYNPIDFRNTKVHFGLINYF